MSTNDNTHAALLAALTAIVAECMDYPIKPRYSTDSYLPPHLLEAAQQALELLDGGKAKRFATLQAQFALLGHTLYRSSPNDGPGPVSYLVERCCMVRHLLTLDEVELFLSQIGGAHV